MSEQLTETEIVKKDILKKVILLGDSGTGKTSLILRIILNQFSLETKTTIGADFSFKTFEDDKCNTTLQIWDTAGQEKFSGVGTQFYRGSDVAIFTVNGAKAFDKTCQNNLDQWVFSLRSQIPDAERKKVKIYFAINKSDELHDDFKNEAVKDTLFNLVGDFVGKENKANFKNRHIVFCSAKDDTNINALFKRIVNDTKPFRERLEEYTSRLNWFGALLKAIFSFGAFRLAWKKQGLAAELLAEVKGNEEDKMKDEGARNTKYLELIATYGIGNADLVRKEHKKSWFFEKNYAEIDPKQPDRLDLKLGELGDILEQESSQLRAK